MIVDPRGTGMADASLETRPSRTAFTAATLK